MIKVGDAVTVVKTRSSLDDVPCTVVGKHMDGYWIVLFDYAVPTGYNPAIVISKHCLIARNLKDTVEKQNANP